MKTKPRHGTKVVVYGTGMCHGRAFGNAAVRRSGVVDEYSKGTGQWVVFVSFPDSTYAAYNIAQLRKLKKQ